MKTVDLGSLPAGSQVRGILYDDPAHVYGLGDVLEVELPTGLTIDVGWDEDSTERRFRVAVYREYFGDRFVDFHVRDVDDVVIEVQRLATEWSQPCVVTSPAQTEAAISLPNKAETGT